MNLHVGIDVGGTFTDLVLHDERTGDLVVGKVLSSFPDPAEGVLTGFRQLLADTGTDGGSVTYLAHASTVASNLVLERKGDATALVTTAGFRDVLLLQRQKRAVSHDLFYDKPEPLIPRRHIFEVPERTAADGTILQPLDEDTTVAALRGIAAKDIKALAVCLLHAYANPAHEQRIQELAAREAPDLLVSLSSEVSPKWREYERASTTAINAYVMPPVNRYLDGMESSLQAEGLTRPVYVLQSSGGVARADSLKRTPVVMLESGPAAGALMGGVIGQRAGRSNVIAFDMGGTTAKVSIAEDGEPHLVEEFEIAPTTKLRPGSGLPVSIPAVDLIEIGTGGGSIAHLDTGVLAVGPESAGAAPGPACYGKGGTAPTVTDANLVLGYLAPDYFLGGELALDTEAARAALEEGIAKPLDLSVEEAAAAVHVMANASMANATRVVTIQRGLDPRDFALVAFGGAGPTHAASIAAELGVREVLVPANAGVMSALGLLTAQIKFELVRTLRTPLERDALEHINAVYEELEGRGRQALSDSGVSSDERHARQARMRYLGQGYEISVDVPGGKLGPEALDQVRVGFLDTYKRLYGYADPEGVLEIVDYRVTTLGPTPRAVEGQRPGRDVQQARKGTRQVYFESIDGVTETAVWDRYALTPGSELGAPAIVEERESTTVIPPGAQATVDDALNIVIDLAGRGGAA